MRPVEIPVAAVVPVHMGQALTGESPYWDPLTGRLWWIDIQGQRLLSFSPTSGATSSTSLPQMPGLVAGHVSGDLVLGLEDGLYRFSPAAGLGARIVAVEADDEGTRLNDGKADPMGRLWFGTMDKTGSGAPVGSLYCLDLDGSIRQERTSVRVPNAIAFSPGGATMYFADSRSRTVEAIVYDVQTGRTARSRPFVVYPEAEAPDGVCVDEDGGVWIAVVGGSRIERRDSEGKLSVTVHLPVSRPTMPMLGGADGRSLFVTSQRRFLPQDRLRAEPLAGQLLTTRVDVAGITPHSVNLRL